MAVLLNDAWYSARVKVCVIVVYAPTEDYEERERFWNGRDKILD